MLKKKKHFHPKRREVTLWGLEIACVYGRSLKIYLYYIIAIFIIITFSRNSINFLRRQMQMTFIWKEYTANSLQHTLNMLHFLYLFLFFRLWVCARRENYLTTSHCDKDIFLFSQLTPFLWMSLRLMLTHAHKNEYYLKLYCRHWMEI